MLTDEMSDRISESRNTIEGGSLDSFWAYHRADGVPASAEVVDEAELVGPFALRNSEDRHGVHPGEEVFSEGRGPSARIHLFIALVSKELACTLVLMRGTGLIPGKGIVFRLFIGKELAEALAQTSEDRVDKRTVRVIKQEFFEAIDIDWGDYFKEVRERF